MRVARLSGKIKAFWRNEDGIGTLEILLIIAVIVVIFLLFKSFIMEYVNKIITTTGKKMDDAL